MAALTITYNTLEDLCELLKTTLETLPACGSLPSDRVSRQQVLLSLNGLPNVSTQTQLARPTKSPDQSSTAPTETSDSTNENDDDAVPVVTEGDELLSEGMAANKARTRKEFGTAKGLEEVRRLGTLGIVEALGAIGTVSKKLARATGLTLSATHLNLASPTIAASPRDAKSKRQRTALKKALLAEADVNLLNREPGQLLGTRDAIDSSLFVSNGKLNEDAFKFQRELQIRIAGNLEILRIEAQEEL